jgi:two-component system LytT family response regulator
MSDYLKLNVKKGHALINPDRIVYVEASNKHSIICLNDQKKIELKSSLKYIEAILDEPVFYRIHDSFIINCFYFESIYNLRVILQGNFEVPISRYKKQLFEKNLEKYYNLIESVSNTSEK